MSLATCYMTGYNFYYLIGGQHDLLSITNYILRYFLSRDNIYWLFQEKKTCL